MKKQIRILITLAIALLSFIGCATLKSPVAKAVFSIAIRSAAYEIGKNNPGSIQDLVKLSTFFLGLEDIISPQTLSEQINGYVDRSNLDDFHKRNVEDLASIAEAAYGQLYEKHKDVLTDNQAAEVLQSIGRAMQFGLVPSVDSPGEFVLESASLIVVVD
jgi:hypothetical protein